MPASARAGVAATLARQLVALSAADGGREWRDICLRRSLFEPLALSALRRKFPGSSYSSSRPSLFVGDVGARAGAAASRERYESLSSERRQVGRRAAQLSLRLAAGSKAAANASCEREAQLALDLAATALKPEEEFIARREGVAPPPSTFFGLPPGFSLRASRRSSRPEQLAPSGEVVEFAFGLFAARRQSGRAEARAASAAYSDRAASLLGDQGATGYSFYAFPLRAFSATNVAEAALPRRQLS